MSETLELKARRIGDDVTNVWTLLQSKGGVLPHNVNTENLVDVLNQIVAVDKWNAKGVFFYTPDGFYDFYTTHEVNRWTEMPEAPAGTSWVISLADLKAWLENHTYMLVGNDAVFPFDSSFHLVVDNPNYLTVTLMISVEGAEDDVKILWGDGTMSPLTSISATRYSHTYSSTGTYDLALEISGHTRVTVHTHHPSYNTPQDTSYSCNMFGQAGYSPNVGFIWFRYMTSAIIGPKTGFGGTSFSPGVSSPGSTPQTTNLTSVFYSHDPEEIVQLAGAPITNYVMPSTATEFYSQDGQSSYSGGFFGCRNLASVTMSPYFHVIPHYCFKETSITSLDFSNVKEIRSQAFEGVNLTGIVDLSNVEVIKDSNFRVLSDNNTTTKIILNHEVVYDEQNAKNNRYAISTLNGMFMNLTNLEEINIPTTWTVIPRGFVHNSDIDVESLTFPHNLEYIGSNALASNRYSSLANIIANLPDSLIGFGGTGLYSYHPDNPTDDLAGVTWPANMAELGGNPFYNRKIKNLSLPSTLAIGNYAFSHMRMLEDTLTIPSTWTFVSSTPQYAFQEAHIKKVVVGNSSFLSSGIFNSLYTDEIEFAAGLNPTNLNSAFSNIYGGANGGYSKITVPASVTTLNANEFGQGIEHITFEGQVPALTTANCLARVNNVTRVHDMTNCTTVPTLNVAALGTNYTDRMEFIVPDALYALWIADTNWADAIANKHINVIKASEA